MWYLLKMIDQRKNSDYAGAGEESHYQFYQTKQLMLTKIDIRDFF